jgi:hypothetical protein
MSKGVSRRQFAALGAVAALATQASVGHAATPVTRRSVKVSARAGSANAELFHPAEGQHPGVVLWTDVAGLREANAEIGRKLAAAGLAVLMVDPAHRGGLTTTRAEAIVHGLKSDFLQQDGADFSAWLDAQPETRSSAGGYVLRAMGATPSALTMRSRPKLARSGYLVSVPAGKSALTASQRAALEQAINATEHLAAAEVHSSFAA